MKKPLLVTVVILFLILLTKQSQAEDNWYYVEIPGSTTRIVRYNATYKEYIISNQISMKLEGGKLILSVDSTAADGVHYLSIRNYSNRGALVTEVYDSTKLEVEDTKLINGSNYRFYIWYTGAETSEYIEFSLYDRVPPSISVSCPDTWARSQELQISSTSSIGLSTLTLNEDVILPVETTSFTVYGNGTYVFKATDILGDVGTYTIEVNNIDIVNPTVDIALAED